MSGIPSTINSASSATIARQPGAGNTRPVMPITFGRMSPLTPTASQAAQNAARANNVPVVKGAIFASNSAFIVQQLNGRTVAFVGFSGKQDVGFDLAKRVLMAKNLSVTQTNAELILGFTAGDLRRWLKVREQMAKTTDGLEIKGLVREEKQISAKFEAAYVQAANIALRAAPIGQTMASMDGITPDGIAFDNAKKTLAELERLEKLRQEERSSRACETNTRVDLRPSTKPGERFVVVTTATRAINRETGARGGLTERSIVLTSQLVEIKVRGESGSRISANNGTSIAPGFSSNPSVAITTTAVPTGKELDIRVTTPRNHCRFIRDNQKLQAKTNESLVADGVMQVPMSGRGGDMSSGTVKYRVR